MSLSVDVLWGTIEPSVVSAVLRGCAVKVWMCMCVSVFSIFPTVATQAHIFAYEFQSYIA